MCTLWTINKLLFLNNIYHCKWKTFSISNINVHKLWNNLNNINHLVQTKRKKEITGKTTKKVKTNNKTLRKKTNILFSSATKDMWSILYIPFFHPDQFDKEGKQASKQINWQIIVAGKMIQLVLMYHVINWSIAYLDRPKMYVCTILPTGKTFVVPAHTIHNAQW